ncbi:hypothetical protein C548_106 [Candidatus Portiera aleyrodidarum BT-QVLC]|nr:hypothetical protein C548_106 [Candidatus Portiera aleyrodidarum BT-QVLC]
MWKKQKKESRGKCGKSRKKSKLEKKRGGKEICIVECVM